MGLIRLLQNQTQLTQKRGVKELPQNYSFEKLYYKWINREKALISYTTRQTLNNYHIYSK